MSAARAKGTRWETAIVDFLKSHGWLHAERRALGGKRDRGDIAGIPGVVVEAKATNRIELAAWIAEAEAERANDGAAYGVAWAKRKGKTGAADGYVVMTGETFVRLLKEAGY